MHGHRVAMDVPGLSPELRRSLFAGAYERDKLEQMKVKIEPNDVVVDVGAGLGITAMFAASMVGPENVVAIEADPRASEISRRNFALNGLEITLLEGAAVSGAGTSAGVEFYVNEALGRSSLFPRDGGLDPVTVEAVDLEALIRERQVSALNVDVQGSEYDLLCGIEDFGRVRVVLLSVHQPAMGYERSVALMRHLFDAGFALDFAHSLRGAVSLARHRF